MEEGLLIQVSFIAAALPFLEAAVVKGFKFPEYGSLQLIKGAEHFIPEPGDDCCRNLADSPLHRCFLFGLADSRRHDGCLVMASKGFIISRQDDLPFPGMGHDACLQVVADEACGHTAKVLVHMDMGADEGIHLHVPAGLYIGILAVWQGRHEQIDFHGFPCCRIHIFHHRA